MQPPWELVSTQRTRDRNLYTPRKPLDILKTYRDTPRDTSTGLGGQPLWIVTIWIVRSCLTFKTSSDELPPPRVALCSHFRIHGMFTCMPLYATTASQRWRSAATWPLSALHRRHGVVRAHHLDPPSAMPRQARRQPPRPRCRARGSAAATAESTGQTGCRCTRRRRRSGRGASRRRVSSTPRRRASVCLLRARKRC